MPETPRPVPDSSVTQSNRSTSPCRWELHIDESGQFEVPQDEVVVGGVLFQVVADIHGTEHLKSGLKTQLPHLWWPLHTTDLNRAAYHLCSLVLMHQLNTSTSLSKLYQQIHSTMRLNKEVMDQLYKWITEFISQAGEHYAVVREQANKISLREKIDRDPLEPVMQWLKKTHPDVYKALETLVRQSRYKFFTAIQDWSNLQKKLVLAAEEQINAGSIYPDRYLPMLQQLLERVVYILSCNEGDHHVRLFVGTRHVLSEDGKKEYLNATHVNNLLGNLRCIPGTKGVPLLYGSHPSYFQWNGSNISFEVGAVLDHRVRTTPFASVVSDALCNVARKEISGLGTEPLSLLHDNLQVWLALLCCSGEPHKKSHVSAGPEWNRYFQDSARTIGYPTVRSPIVRRPWAKQQWESWWR